MSTRTEILESMAKNVEALGPWLAASLDDPKACAEYVAACRQVLESLQALRELAAVPPFPWERLPVDASWVAMDEDGRWFVYTERPLLGDEVWVAAPGACSAALRLADWRGPRAPDWRESLQQRPE